MKPPTAARTSFFVIPEGHPLCPSCGGVLAIPPLVERMRRDILGPVVCTQCWKEPAPTPVVPAAGTQMKLF